MTEIKAWLLDLDGTLYKERPVKLLMTVELALLGPFHVSVLSTFRRQLEILRHELNGDPALVFEPSPFDEQLRRTSQISGKPEAQVRALVMDWMIERPGRWMRWARRQTLLTRVAEFRAQGGKTACVSDYPAQKKLAAMGASSLFDAVVASGEDPDLKRLKPRPDGFALAAHRLGIEPENCLVFGDRQDADGDAARALGMQFEWVRASTP